MSAFVYIRRVDFVDTDVAGIMHFSNFFRYMEAAEVAFLRSLGCNVKFIWEGEELGFPRVSAHCDYQSPARFDDLLEVTVTLEKLGRKSLAYRFDFSRSGQPLAQGKLTAVCCRVRPDHQLESVEIPASLRAKFAQVLE